jgi:Protein of unknown function (DUF1501)
MLESGNAGSALAPRRSSRRKFLATAAAASLGAVTSQGLPRAVIKAEGSSGHDGRLPQGKAEHCIFIWLGGGACHIDTFDPKRRGDGKQMAGSYYDAVDTAISGVHVCEHLRRTAAVLDRCVLVRSIFHKSVDEHAAATNLMHTGRPTSGTIVYPSIGSVVAHERAGAADGVPPYVVMGYPNVTRGPGFLGSKYGYIYLTETDAGPNGLKRSLAISDIRQARREALLSKLRDNVRTANPDDKRLQDYADASEAGFRLAGPKFMRVFDLASEPGRLRDDYGSEFGQRLLLARRLVQSGVRFIEVASNLNFVNGTGWDTHNEGQLKQHELIEELDQGFSSLIRDLESHGLLEKTLVVIATEFGRPPEFDAGGGRGHQSAAFSCVLAGGGLRTGRAIGATDELGKNVEERPVSVPDLHATIHCALGVNPSAELYDGERPVPITDQGKPIQELFA